MCLVSTSKICYRKKFILIYTVLVQINIISKNHKILRCATKVKLNQIEKHFLTEIGTGESELVKLILLPQLNADCKQSLDLKRWQQFYFKKKQM